MGNPRNLGDPAVSVISTVVGEATAQITPAQGRRPTPLGANNRHGTVPPKRTIRKRGGMGGRKSEQLGVAVKAGNRSEGPAGAKGLPNYGPVGAKDVGNTKSHKRLK